jgi:phosphatidylserine/phosphatidylglycerophosphate/cardiolipin synthase-like enzyme
MIITLCFCVFLICATILPYSTNARLQSAYAAIGYDYRPTFVAHGSNFFGISDSSALRLSSSFSLAAWFKTNSDYSGNAMIANKGGFGSDSVGKNMNYGIWMNSAEKLVAGFESSSGTDYFVSSPISYRDNSWHYAVVTFSSSTLKLYVDGQMIGSKSTNGALPDNKATYPLRIGANSQQKNLFFNGQIDEVRLWNRALSANEILSQYTSASFNTNGQLQHLKMDLLLLFNEDYFYQIREEIQNAKSSIHVAMYLVQYTPNQPSWRNNIILDEIVEAKNRGVQVRFILGNMDRYPDTDNFLAANGIPYKTGASHAKLVIIDGKTVFVGTHNLNRHAFEFNKEESIMTVNSAVAIEAKTFYDGWWNNGKPAHVVTDLTKGEAFLTASEYYNGLAKMIDSAQKRIRLNMYLVEYLPANPSDRATILLTKIKQAHDRGVDVKVLIDDHTKKTYPATITFLQDNDIPFKLDAVTSPGLDSFKVGIDHSKLVIIDNVFYVGGRNWKGDLSSDRIPDYMTRNSVILSRALSHFDSQWAIGRTI